MTLFSVLICLIFFSSDETGIGLEVENQKNVILQKYIEMHNTASDDAIRSFINECYHPDLLDEIKMDKQIEFYNHIITEFGALQPAVYHKEEETECKLIVHLIPTKYSITNPMIGPEDILRVEIDIHSKDIDYLARGVGLGALVCSIDRN